MEVLNDRTAEYRRNGETIEVEMSRMIPVTGKKLVKVLEKVGFEIKCWRGSHAIMDNGYNRLIKE